MTLVTAYQFQDQNTLEDRVAIGTPAPGLDIDWVATNGVPFGTPYVIVDSSKTNNISFTNPDGIGQGEF